MEKPVFPEVENQKKDDVIMTVEVKVTREGEILLSSSTDNDMLILKLLIDAAQGNVTRIIKGKVRTVQAIRLVNPINGGVHMPR